jgi:hypothetical protein
MSPSIRTTLAVAICLLSAVLGAIAIRQGWGSVSSVAMNVACAWFLSGSWLAGDFSRQGWERLHKSIATIYREARQGKLPKTPPLARVMNSGGMNMLLAGIVSWVVWQSHPSTLNAGTNSNGDRAPARAHRHARRNPSRGGRGTHVSCRICCARHHLAHDHRAARLLPRHGACNCWPVR